MNYEKDLTPRERVDDAMLARLLDEDEHRRSDDFGRSGRQATGNTPCGCNCGCGEEHPVNPCGCGAQESMDGCHAHVRDFGVEHGILAALYVPIQCFDELYDAETALRRGTLFRELDKPFYGSGKEVNCRGQYE